MRQGFGQHKTEQQLADTHMNSNVTDKLRLIDNKDDTILIFIRSNKANTNSSETVLREYVNNNPTHCVLLL